MRPFSNRHARWTLLVVVTLPIVCAPLAFKPMSETLAPPDWKEAYGKLPMSFEANQGQTDASVQFLSRGSGYSLFLTSGNAMLVLSKNTEPATGKHEVPPRRDAGPERKSTTVQMQLVGANADAQASGEEELPGKSNYFIGNDPAKWRTNIPTYAKVRYSQVYSGIDLVYYGKDRQVEYDFVIAPGADPNAIRLSFEGTQRPAIGHDGELVLKVGTGQEELRWRKPVVYQLVNKNRREVKAEYALLDGDRVGFKVDRYDIREPLVIDPILSYSTYFGGLSSDQGEDIAVDGSGNVYVTGASGSDGFVLKLNAAGSALLYSTYLGGNASDGCRSIAVDGSGNAYVTGLTYSQTFPTVNPLQPVHGSPNNGTDAFVAKLNAAGSALVYSTFLGGNDTDEGYGIVVDGSGNAYVTGYTLSTNFPRVLAFQNFNGGTSDAFVAKVNAAGSALTYSTYLGGNDGDYGWGIAVDGSGNAYVTGETASTNFPRANAFQSALANGPAIFDGFVTKLNAAGSALVYSTYFGGNGHDYGNDIAVDSSGNAYIAGVTQSTNFPRESPLQVALSGPQDGFVTKLNAEGSGLYYSTYLGGTSSDGANGIAVDASGNAYITGITDSPNFPSAAALRSLAGSSDAFVTKLNAAGTTLTYSTFLGGSSSDSGEAIAVDTHGNAYVTGKTSSTDFPTVNPLQSSFSGVQDAFVARIRSSNLLAGHDFDGDEKTDATVFRPSTATWYILQSSGNYTTSLEPIQWGQNTDIAVPGDYDGDGKTDPAVFRPSDGTWRILKSSTNYTTSFSVVEWGINPDQPVPGDYDGDQKTDLAVYRPSTGVWYILQSTTYYASGFSVGGWGAATDQPVPADYDGDGKTDIAFWRPSTGVWYILKSSTNYTTSTNIGGWGDSADKPVPGDYDGDGKTDIAVYRPSTAVWYMLKSSTNYATSFSVGWGFDPDKPIPGDYDGDGKTDIAVWRPSTGVWYVLNSSTNYTTSFSTGGWGASTDIPIPYWP